MRRVVPLILTLSLAALMRADGEDTSSSGQELRELRQAVELQSKQIELLGQQIGRLTRALEAQRSGETAAKPAETTPAPTVTTTIESPKPSGEVAAEAPKGEGVPKAEAAPGGKHVVAKGETLTSIAKHYNITIADLKNANKIDNERKIQIGTILSIPTPKVPEQPEKKENP